MPCSRAGVHELIAGQHSKAAVEAAKELHKRCATPASQSLLIEAYQARIRDLLRLGMLVSEENLIMPCTGTLAPVFTPPPLHTHTCFSSIGPRILFVVFVVVFLV